MKPSCFFKFIDNHSLGMLRHYRNLAKSQWYSRDTLRVLQLSKLRNLCAHFGVNIDGWNDFESLPLTTKDELRSYQPTERRYSLVETSGSRGEPFRFAVPPERHSINMATELRNWEWLGWNGQFSVRLTRGEPSWRWRFYTWLLNIASRNYRTVNGSYLRLLRKKPYIVRGGTTAVRTLTWLAQNQRLTADGTNCLLIGENPQKHIEPLAEFYGGVYQSYGLAECVNVASECEHHSLHVNMENCIAESVNGEIVITALNNHVTPFIRYRTGDRGKVKRSNCKCGRPYDVITVSEGKGADFYAGPEVKWPLAWWLVSPLGHNYKRYVRRYKVIAYPKDGFIRLFVIPKLPRKQAVEGLKPYCRWVEQRTGLPTEIMFVDVIPEGRDLLQVILD